MERASQPAAAASHAEGEEQRYDVLAGAELADVQDQVLKHDDSFAVFDRHGDIRPVGLGEEGVYTRGTRHLSGWLLRIAGRRPLLLGSTARKDNARLSVDLTNTDIGAGAERIAHSSLHIGRTKVLWDEVLHERLVVRSFARRAIAVSLELRFDADFADIFEVRGMRRERRGEVLPVSVTRDRVVLAYRGLDGVERRTGISFSPAPDVCDGERAVFEVRLDASQSVTIDVEIACESGPAQVTSTTYPDAAQHARQELRRVLGAASVTTSNELFNDWLERSESDLAMLTTPTDHGLYPYAGVPWFSTPFGRDGIIAALQSLWIAPRVALGVLSYLAANQATEVDPASDAQPGKILHEVRHGEMAALGEVPFGRYYGSVDATPLFVMLAAAYWRQTDDVATIERLWPNLERALEWMDRWGDADGDGFVEYARQTHAGLRQQGWKDSADSVFQADGSLATGPIALCEVQGYAFAARSGAADLAERLGQAERAAELRRQAADLREQFDAAFWDDELATYVIALDGEKRPCRIRASNAAHALLTGIARPERAERLVPTLMSDASYSGWGIRTVAAGEARYNPISYHNGSVWPHDNAMAALGLSRYGFLDASARILEDAFESSRFFDLSRLPELFCGFTRRPGSGPTRYPVACSPQAWSAGSVFMLLQAALGMEVDAQAHRVHMRHSRLPTSIDSLVIRDMPVGQARLDLELERQAEGVGIRVTRRSGKVEVAALK
jgi:glycogen debranching enzyme